MFRLIALLAIFSVAFGDVLKTMECPDSEDASTGFLEEVYSPNFGADETIILHSGSTYSFGMKFYGGYNSATLVPKIYALIGGIQAPWNGAGNNACNNLVEGTKCPIAQDSYYHYSANLTVPSVGNINNVVFQWALKDTANGKSHSCFRMTVNIAST